MAVECPPAAFRSWDSEQFYYKDRRVNSLGRKFTIDLQENLLGNKPDYRHIVAAFPGFHPAHFRIAKHII
jgi:hypothetical protein